MSEKQIVVTLSQPVQIGAYEWRQHHVSRTFVVSRSIGDMLSWAESEGVKNPHISDLLLSEYTGSSF